MDFEIVGVMFEGIDGLMPVGRQNVASSTGEALIDLHSR